jgi:hypothetical protein
MDTEQIEQTAQHLASLGCTREQIERHLKPLRSIAMRAAKQPKRSREPTFLLTQGQIDALLPKLRERQWRWIVERPRDDTSDWVGHAILSITGTPNLRADTTNLVADVLTQLRRLGLIERVPITAPRQSPAEPRLGAYGGAWQWNVVRHYAVRVIEVQPQRKPRERLGPAEQPDCAALSGFAGSGHSETADHAPASL